MDENSLKRAFASLSLNKYYLYNPCKIYILTEIIVKKYLYSILCIGFTPMLVAMHHQKVQPSLLCSAFTDEITQNIANSLSSADLLRVSRTCKASFLWVKSFSKAHPKFVVHFFPRTHGDPFFGSDLFAMCQQKANGTFDADKDGTFFQSLLSDAQKAIDSQKEIIKHLSQLLNDNDTMPVFSEGLIKDTQTVCYVRDFFYGEIRTVFKDSDFTNLTEEQNIYLVYFGAASVLHALGKIKHLLPCEDRHIMNFYTPLHRYARLGKLTLQ